MTRSSTTAAPTSSKAAPAPTSSSRSRSATARRSAAASAARTIATTPPGRGSAAARVYANLDDAAWPAGSPGESLSCPTGTPDHLEGIEDLEGSEGNDVLIGNEAVEPAARPHRRDIYRALGGEDTIFANSGSRDLAIDCGEGTDAAVIDFAATIGDPAPIGCESVREAAPNEYRTAGRRTAAGAARRTAADRPTPATTPTVRDADDRAYRRRTSASRSPTARRRGRSSSATRRRCCASPTASAPRSRSASPRASAPTSSASSTRRAFHSCRSPFRARLAAGRHTFRVYAIDAAGNRDRTPSLLHLRVVSRARLDSPGRRAHRRRVRPGNQLLTGGP